VEVLRDAGAHLHSDEMAMATARLQAAATENDDGALVWQLVTG